MSEKDRARYFVRFLKEEGIYHYFKGVYLCTFLPNWHSYFIEYNCWFFKLRKIIIPSQYNINKGHDFWAWYDFKWLVYIYDHNLDNNIIDVLLSYYKRLTFADYEELSPVNRKIIIHLKKIVLK